MSDEELETRALLMAAGMLDEGEARRLRDAIADGDEQSRAALDAAEEILAQLPTALEPRFPGPQVREELMRRARESGATGTAPASARGWAIAGWAVAAALALALVMAPPADRTPPPAGPSPETAIVERTSDESTAIESRLEEVESELSRFASSLTVKDREIERLRARVVALAAEGDDLEADGSLERAARLAAEERARTLSSRLQATSNELQAATRAAADRERGDASVLEQANDDVQRLREALALVRAPDVGIVELVDRREAGRASASVFWDRGLRSCYLHARDLEPTTGEGRYALWLEYSSGRIVRVTEFAVESGTTDVDAYAALPVGLGEIVRTFVTREASAGRDVPSGALALVEPAPADGDGAPGAERRRYRRRS